MAFSNQQSYIAAISARFVQLQHADIEKRVEVKPYVLDDQVIILYNYEINRVLKKNCLI